MYNTTDLAGIFITYAVAVMIAIILYVADRVAEVPVVKQSLEPASRYSHYVAVFVTEFMVAMVIIPATALLSIPNAVLSKCRRIWICEHRGGAGASGDSAHEPHAVGITAEGAVGIHDGGPGDEEAVRDSDIELVTGVSRSNPKRAKEEEVRFA